MSVALCYFPEALDISSSNFNFSNFGIGSKISFTGRAISSQEIVSVNIERRKMYRHQRDSLYKRRLMVRYNLSFVVYKPDMYILEVRLLWWNGAAQVGEPDTKYLGGQGLRGRSFNHSCHSKTHVWGSPLPINLSLPFQSQSSLFLSSSLCDGTQHNGRWLRFDATSCGNVTFIAPLPEVLQLKHIGGELILSHFPLTNYSKHIGISGNPCQLIDSYGLNSNWYWKPDKCLYHFYNESDIAKCFISSGITGIVLWGDSLLEEVTSNLQSFSEININYSVVKSNGKKKN